MKNEKRVGLSLSGGGYRAAAFHLGTLRKLKALGILLNTLNQKDRPIAIKFAERFRKPPIAALEHAKIPTIRSQATCMRMQTFSFLKPF